MVVCTAARRALYNAFIKPALSAEPGPFLPFLLPLEHSRRQSSSSGQYAWRPLVDESPRPPAQDRSPPQETLQSQDRPRPQYNRSSDNFRPAPSRQTFDRQPSRSAGVRRPRILRLPPPPMENRPYKTPWDDEIKDEYIGYKDRENNLQSRVPTWRILADVDPQQEHLITIGKIPDPKVDGAFIPLCKVYGRQQLRELDQASKQKAKDQKKLFAAPKNLEINWATASADLQKKLGQFKTFLAEGRRVEILLARKKGTRKAQVEESQRIIDKVKEAAKEVEAKQAGEAKGEIGARMMIVFKREAGALRPKKDAEDSATEADPA